MRDISASFSIFNFLNYRDFLNAYAKEAKAQNPRWTRTDWAQKMGIFKVTSLSLILSGERRIGEKSLKKMIRYFQFSEEEERYFALLVRREENRDDRKVCNIIDEEIRSLSYRPQKMLLDDKALSLISDWYYLAIHQMAHLGPLQDDAKWVQDRLKQKVPLSNLEKALANLVAMELLIRKEGKLYLSEKQSFHTLQDVPSKAIRRHHEDMLENAIEALHSVPVTEREFQGKTLTVSLDQLLVAKEMIREFTKQFGRKLDTEKGNAVYQLNLQFFPLSENLEKQNEVHS